MRAMEQAKEQYEHIPVPTELSERVRIAIDSAPAQQRRMPQLMPYCASAMLGMCATFILLLNTNAAFANSLEDVPFWGGVAKILTLRSYEIENEVQSVHVRIPEFQFDQDDELERRINYEIRAKVDAMAQEIQERAQMYRRAFIDTGGRAEEFMPILVDIDYRILCSNAQIVSFELSKCETMASAYTEYIYYNIDLQTGRELTLQDVLGPDYEAIMNDKINAEIDARLHNGEDFFEGEGSFAGIQADQKFYINADMQVVAVFEKYEIAPGSMGKIEIVVGPSVFARP